MTQMRVWYSDWDEYKRHRGEVGAMFVPRYVPKGLAMTDEKPPEGTPPPDHILQFFQFEHLPKQLAEISRPFCYMAKDLVNILPRNPERTVALRKLLEAKDAAVRALVAKP